MSGFPRLKSLSKDLEDIKALPSGMLASPHLVFEQSIDDVWKQSN